MNYRKFYDELNKRIQNQAEVVVSTCLTGDSRGEKYFGNAQDRNAFTERFHGQTTVVLCGAGHVALAVAKLLDELEYRIIVIDDREEFVNTHRFPMADELRCIDFGEDFSKEEFPEGAYYVIVTRGHEHDYTCLKSALRRKYGYIGMIGSRKKVAVSKSRLREDGFDPEEISQVHAPIGLPIGGETPMEVAISIAAEIVQMKNQSVESILEGGILEGLETRIPAVMVTVVSKKGSSPRGRGSRMLVLEDGRTYGSIGGGAVEYIAIKQALKMFQRDKFATEIYDLSNTQAANLGMICGGQIEVMFEVLDGK